jgi:hypothetical protein
MPNNASACPPADFKKRCGTLPRTIPRCPVRRHDGIVRAKGLHNTNRHRFLADVQMKKAADLARAVELRTLLLEAADAQHFP